MNTTEQLRQVQESLARISRMKTMPDHKCNTFTLGIAHDEAIKALALMPAIIASVEEMGKAVDEAKLYSDITEVAWQHTDNQPVAMVDKIMDIINPHLRPSEREVDIEAAVEAIKPKFLGLGKGLAAPMAREVVEACATAWGLKWK